MGSRRGLIGLGKAKIRSRESWRGRSFSAWFSVRRFFNRTHGLLFQHGCRRFPSLSCSLPGERKTLFAAPGMTAVLAFFCGVAFVNGMQETREHILKYKDYNAARVAFLEKHTLAGDAIIFQDSGNMEHAGPLFFDRVFLLLKGPEDRERIARMLHARGVAGIYEWTVNPLGIETYNPYASEKPPAYPLPPWARRCCGGSCEERRYYLVRLETGAGLWRVVM